MQKAHKVAHFTFAPREAPARSPRLAGAARFTRSRGKRRCRRPESAPWPIPAALVRLVRRSRGLVVAPPLRAWVRRSPSHRRRSRSRRRPGVRRCCRCRRRAAGPAASLKVDVEVAGGVAQTRVQMVFLNPNNRILEGKLQFPLAPGQVVSGFSLDVEGHLRAAVPIEKARGQQVFEDIARRRVDPGLLETTIGNNYELRIYPLLPGKTRAVELRIVEPASGRAADPARRMPIASRALALSLRVPRCDERARADRRPAAPRPALRARAGRRLRRARDCHERHRAAERRARHCACRGATARARRSRPKSVPARATSRSSCRCRSAARRGRCRATVMIVWDASGSERTANASTASSRSSMPISRQRATPRCRAGARRRRRRAAAALRGSRRRLIAPARPRDTVYDGAEQPRRGAPRRRLGERSGSATAWRPTARLAARVSGARLRDPQRHEQ